MQEGKGKAPHRLRQRAIALLARREYPRAELAARLIAAGATEAEVGPVLDELESAGYLSDTRFASALVRRKAAAYGKRAIANAMREKGVSADVARDALAQIGPEDELAMAQALWRRRFGTPPADERAKARQLRFLLSRGYSRAVAFKVLKLGSAGGDAC